MTWAMSRRRKVLLLLTLGPVLVATAFAVSTGVQEPGSVAALATSTADDEDAPSGHVPPGATRLAVHRVSEWGTDVHQPRQPDINGDGMTDLLASVGAVHHQFAAGRKLPPIGTPSVILQSAPRVFTDQGFLRSWSRTDSGGDSVLLRDATGDGRDDLISIEPSRRLPDSCHQGSCSATALTSAPPRAVRQWLSVQAARPGGGFAPPRRARLLGRNGRAMSFLPPQSVIGWQRQLPGRALLIWTKEPPPRAAAPTDANDPTSPAPGGPLEDMGSTLYLDVAGPMTFKTRGSYKGWYGPSADVDGDGNPELIMQQPSVDEFVMFDTTTASGHARPIELPDGVLGDVTGDGVADVVGVRKKTGKVKVYIGHGDGTFSKPKVVKGVTIKDRYLYELADIDGDDQVDLLIGTRSYDPERRNPYGSAWQMLMGDGDGGFAPGPRPISTPGWLDVAVTDLDADGKVDLLLSGDDPEWVPEDKVISDATFVAWGRGDGTFE